MSVQDYSPTSDEMQRFTATGRPYKAPSKSDKYAWAMNSATNDAAWGRAAPNLLPQRYNDDSLISVPVMRPEDIGVPEGHKKEKKSLFSSRRKSENNKFTVKQMPRGEYLKYYAKDEQSRYIGSEDPAPDCILRGEDVDKYRGKQKLEYKDEIGSITSADTRDGVIR